jgi:cytochrome c556
MKKVALLGAVLAVGTVGALAQDDPAELRNRLMSAMWVEGISTLLRMGRGQEPYDAGKADRALARVTELAQQIQPLWPAGSMVEKPTTQFASSPKVWETKGDFDARLARLTSVVAENREKAMSGPQGALTAFRAVNTYCDSCHEQYRMKMR